MPTLNHEHRMTLNEMNDLLKELDAELINAGYTEPVSINALGGYAMLYYGLRKNNPTTPDIDTSTPTFNSTIQNAITTIAKKHNINPHWLNNDCVLSFDNYVSEMDVAIADSMINAHYIPININTTLIQVSIADIPTLMRAKAQAASDIWASRGDKDLEDCIEILEHEGAHNLQQAKQIFPFLKDYTYHAFKDLYIMAKQQSNKKPYVPLRETYDTTMQQQELNSFDEINEKMLTEYAYEYALF